LPEYQQEIASTRKMLAVVPDGSFEWKPHAKSMSLGVLACHVAELPSWMHVTINTDVLDFSVNAYQPPKPSTVAELLEFFDGNAQQALDVLAAATDEKFMENWTMRNGEQVFFTLPKAAVVRTWVINHMIHHRAQLSVYLRLLDVPVPGTYGPTADYMG
jgi:uncharacterized damage-inducible protein DinB